MDYDSELKGKVLSGAVRGLFTITEGIIIIGDNGHYYGAVIKNGDMIHYYTTNPKFMNRLLESIAE